MRFGIVIALAWFAATAAGGGASNRAPCSNVQPEIPFVLNHRFGAILIQAQVNAEPVTLIVDTGSSQTVVSSALLRLSPRILGHADLRARGSRFVGSGSWAKATLSVGTDTWPDHRVLMMDDFEDMSSSTGTKADGIPGEDLLQEFSVVIIDFKHHRLVLSR